MGRQLCYRVHEEVGGAAVYISQCNILNQSRVNARFLLDLFQQSIYEVLEAGVLEATLLGLCERCPQGEGDYDVVGILGGSV